MVMGVYMKNLTKGLSASELMESILENRFSDVEKMQVLCKQLLGISEPINDLYSCAFANLYLLDYALTQGDFDACCFYLLRTQPLCQENGFDDLLLIMHNIAGLYYQGIFDEQSALQHYLQGLELVRVQQDPVTEGKLLNNMGISFSRRNDDVHASEYFRRAYEALKPHLARLTPTDLGNALCFLCNASEAYCGTKRIDASEKALLEAEALHVNVKHWELVLCHSWCGHYAMCGDSVRSIAYARQLLEDGLEQIESSYHKTNVAMEVCGYMMDVDCQELAQYYLHLSGAYCGADNLGDSYNFQALSIRYYERFGTPEECQQAYRKFYEISIKMNNTNCAMRVQAEIAKIELTRALQDRQEMRRENRELEDASHMDELTWLYNRRYLSKLISKVALDRQTVTIGCIIIDVDYFKQYNDFYGHLKGDDALRCVATLLRENACDGAYPSRYGGDEFLVLCVNWSTQQMESYIKMVQEELSDQQVPHEKSLCSNYLTLSIGYSNGTITDDPSAAQLLEQADKALYEAKSKGRNRFVRASDGLPEIN